MTLKIFSLVPAALLGSMTVVSASTIVQTGTQPSINTDWNSSFTFNEFDSILGTLNSVTATLTDDWNTAGTLKNNASNSATFQFTSSTDVVESGGPAPLSTLANSFNGGTVLYTALAPGASATYGPSSQTLTSTYNSSPADLALFENPGTFNVNVSTLSGTAVRGGGANIAATLTTNADATLQLTYNYTAATVIPPSTVPEPTAAALFGVGLLAMVGIARRRV